MNSDKVNRKAKTRVSVTMTRTYVEALDHLVEEGVYLNRGEIVLAAIRHYLRKVHGLELPYHKETPK